MRRAWEGLNPHLAMSTSRESRSKSERYCINFSTALLRGMLFQIFHGVLERHGGVGGDEDGVVFHPFSLADETAIRLLQGGELIDEGNAPIMPAALRIDDDGLA